MTKLLTVRQHTRKSPHPKRDAKFIETTERLRREVVKLRRVRIPAGRMVV